MRRISSFAFVALVLAISGCGGSSSSSGTARSDSAAAGHACVKIATGEPASCGAPLTESKSAYAKSKREQRKVSGVAHRYAKTPPRRPHSTTSRQPSPEPKPKPPPRRPKPIITKRQACGSYGGTDAFACHDSYEFGCVYGHLKEQVRAYYEGHAPDLSTQALQWARGFYWGQESWEAGMAGCQAALLDEYQRLYSRG